MSTFRTPDGEFPEYTFPRQSTPCGVEWVSLEVAPNRVRKYALCNIVEVIDPRLTGMVYDQPQPCQSLTIWRPTIEIPIWELGYYKPGSKKSAPGLNMNMSNVRLVLTLPEAA
jgi:hypothetical protein